MIGFNPENIPREMKELPRWVLFTLFENTYSHRIEKLPWSLNGKMADITKPETWTTFEKAYSVLLKGGNYRGLGFVLGDGIFGIDLDHVIDEEGNIQAWAGEVIRQMDSYTELSPSGTGIHIFAKGRIPPKDRKNGNIEMYDEKRYFTVTGHPFGELRPLAERTREALAVHRQYLKRDHRESAAQIVRVAGSRPAARDVADLIARAESARNGSKFTALYNGSTASYASQSQADQALCNILAFYANGNAALIDAAFRTSGLMRDKWDSKRGGSTYGEMTIEKAIASIRGKEAEETEKQPEEDRDAPLPVDIAVAVPVTFMEGEQDSSLPVDKTENEEDTEDNAERKDKKEEKKPVIKSDTEKKESAEFTNIRREWKEWKNGAGGRDFRASTGFAALDRRLGGGFGSGIWVLGSEPSIGKTSLALQFARKAARDGAETLYISFEQDTSYLEAKVIAAEMTERMGIKAKADDILKGSRSREAEELIESEDVFERLHFVRGDCCAGEEQLLEMIKRFSGERRPAADQRRRPCVVFIDYLQIIPFAGNAGLRAQIDDFARRLRHLQMTEGICVFLVSSLNRMSYMGPVRLDSFKESGIIEFTGDVILGLNLRAVRSGEYLKLSDSAERAARLEAARGKKIREIEICCLKNKTGESNFTVDVNFDTELGIFTEARK